MTLFVFPEDRNGFGKTYSEDQLAKLQPRFEEDERGFNFSSWNRLRESDGILCRTDYDCLWISGRFLCHQEDLTLSPEVTIGPRIPAGSGFCLFQNESCMYVY